MHSTMHSIILPYDRVAQHYLGSKIDHHMTPLNITFDNRKTITIPKYQQFRLIFPSDSTKIIKVNTLKVFTAKQHIRYFSRTEVVCFLVIPVSISEATLTFMISLQHL